MLVKVSMFIKKFINIHIQPNGDSTHPNKVRGIYAL